MNIEKECLDQFCGREHHNRLWNLRWGSDHHYRLSDIEEVGEELAETDFGSPAMEREQHISSASPSLSSSNNSNSGSLVRESQHQRFIVPAPPSYPPSSNSISENLRERQHQHQRHLPPAAPTLPHFGNSSTENKTRKTGRGHDGRPPSVRTLTDQPTDSLHCLSHHRPDLPSQASRPSKPSSFETASDNWRRAESKARELVPDNIKIQEPVPDLAKTHTNGVKSRREKRRQQDRHQHPPQVTKQLIGLPTDFQHVTHVGFNNTTHVTDDRLSHDSTKLNTLGEQQMLDARTLKLSCDYWDDGDQQDDHHSSTDDDVDQQEVQWVNKDWSRSDSVDDPILSFPPPPAVLSKGMIGPPTDFEHILHIGQDTDDLELQKLMEMASLRQERRTDWKSPDCVASLEVVGTQYLSHGASPTTTKAPTSTSTRATSSTISASPSTTSASPSTRATSSSRLPPPPPPPRKNMMGQHSHDGFSMARQNYDQQQQQHQQQHQQQQPPIMACVEEQQHTSDVKTHDLICDLVEGEREAKTEEEHWEHQGASTITTGDSPPPLPPPPDDLGKDVIGQPTNFKHVFHIDHDTADQQLQQLTKEGRSRRRVNPLKTRKSLPNLFERCEAPREAKNLQPQYGRQQGKVPPPPRMRAPSPKLRKDMIGPPYNFQHIKHIGFNSTSTQGTTEEQLDDLPRTKSRSDVEIEESERQQQEPQWQERQQQEPHWQERQQQEPKWQERQQHEPQWQERQQQEPKWQERQQQEPQWQERRQQEPKWEERQQKEPQWQERQQQEPQWQERQQQEPQWQNQRWSTPHIVEIFPPFTPLSSALSKDMIGPPTNFQHVCHIDHDTVDWELNKKEEDDRSSRGSSSHRAQQDNTQPARLRKVIGPPTNFQHVAHVGINTSWQAGDVRQ